MRGILISVLNQKAVLIYPEEFYDFILFFQVKVDIDQKMYCDHLLLHYSHFVIHYAKNTHALVKLKTQIMSG